MLDPGRVAHEALEYDPPADPTPAPAIPQRICVSLAQITASARQSEPLCFDVTDDGYVPGSPEKGW